MNARGVSGARLGASWSLIELAPHRTVWGSAEPGRPTLHVRFDAAGPDQPVVSFAGTTAVITVRTSGTDDGVAAVDRLSGEIAVHDIGLGRRMYELGRAVRAWAGRAE